MDETSTAGMTERERRGARAAPYRAAAPLRDRIVISMDTQVRRERQERYPEALLC